MLNPQTPSEFIEILNSKPSHAYLLTFTKPTCPACIDMKGFVADIEKKNRHLVFVNLDVSKFDQLAQLNKVDAVPTSKLVVIRDNKIIQASKKVIGFNKSEIEKLIHS